MTTTDRIMTCAANLLEKAGIDAVTTRAVCDAAGVTAPTLYHHFGDKEGLLRAVAARGVARFIKAKRVARATDDALYDLKRGWDAWIGIALERPNLFRLMIQTLQADPSIGGEGFDILRGIVQRLADEGRLRSDVETASRTMWAASNGVLTLFLQGATAADIHISSDLMFDALRARLVR